jgi:ribonuclease-3 family protein
VEASGTARSSAPDEVWVPEDLVDLRGKSARQWSPIALAFLGDAVFELYARGVLFYPPAKPLDYDLKTKRLARAEAQDFLLRLLIDSDTLSEEEVSIVKWGRNAAYGNIPTRLKGKGKGGHGTYRNASALECLLGYLYVVDRARLREVMAIVMSETAIEGALALSSK